MATLSADQTATNDRVSGLPMHQASSLLTPLCPAASVPACRQPKAVTWFMDGKVLKRLANGDNTIYDGARNTLFESPSLPMRPAFTMWTDTRPAGPFGGKIDVSKGPYTATFSNLRHIVCDASVPASATVPAWLA